MNIIGTVECTPETCGMVSRETRFFIGTIGFADF
jgi:hypothetical protein